MDLINVFERKIVEKVVQLGSRLHEMKTLIIWKRFDPIIEKMRKNKTSLGGRPNKDNIQMLKILVLQKWFGMSDPQTERDIYDRASFRDFLDLEVSQTPDFTTVWYFRDKVRKNNLETEIWEELQFQLSNLGFRIEEGTIQDATFVESQVGRKKQQNEKKARKENREVSYSSKQKQHQDNDAKFSVKRGQVHYGYKDHVKTDTKYNFVTKVETTTANIHDSKVDLFKKGDKAAFRDRGYCGEKNKPKADGVIDMTMFRGKNLSDLEKNINKEISRTRCKVERTFAVTGYAFKCKHTFAKSLKRVKIGQLFLYFAYNCYNLFTYKNIFRPTP
jgi:IS5 family transposase